MAHSIMERTCIGCMKKQHKSALLKIIKPKTGEPLIDKEQKNFGRGAYVCFDTKCVDIAMKKKKLQRALRCEIDTLFYDEIKEYIVSINQGE